jgi:DNA-binding NtrC family response regulator
MNKFGVKPARVAAAAQGNILYGESDAAVLASESQVFEQAGYAVSRALGRAAIDQALKSGHYDMLVLGHTLNKDDRHHLPYMAKKSGRETQVLVLHASGKHPAVDIALDSREGHEAVLKAMASLLQRKALAVAV